jgi:Anti-sigma factor NepR
MVRKICKSPFVFPHLDQDQSQRDELRTKGKAAETRELSLRRAPSPQRSANVRASGEPRGEASLLSQSRIGEHIARELKGIYEPIVNQPPPDRFIELLNRLEAGAILEKARSPKS